MNARHLQLLASPPLDYVLAYLRAVPERGSVSLRDAGSAHGKRFKAFKQLVEGYPDALLHEDTHFGHRPRRHPVLQRRQGLANTKKKRVG